MRIMLAILALFALALPCRACNPVTVQPGAGLGYVQQSFAQSYGGVGLAPTVAPGCGVGVGASFAPSYGGGASFAPALAPAFVPSYGVGASFAPALVRPSYGVGLGTAVPVVGVTPGLTVNIINGRQRIFPRPHHGRVRIGVGRGLFGF